jgi:hypothetical protein
MTPLRIRRLCCAIALLTCGARSARAVEDLVTPRSLSMGNALRADATGALGPLINPAGMAMQKSYTIEVMYGFRPQDLGSELHLSVVDSVTSRIAAGLYYSYVHGDQKFWLPGVGPVEATRQGHETGLSLGLPLGDRFAVGLTAKYVNVSSAAPNPAYDPVLNPGAPANFTLDSTTSFASADGFTMDAGLSLRLGDAFKVALVGYNLVPLRSVEAPLSMAIGLSYKVGTVLTLAVDTVIYFDKYRTALILPGSPGAMPGGDDRRTTARVGGGLEWLAGGKVPLRIGALYDSGRPGTYLSMGVGYVAQRFGIDVAYRQQVQAGLEQMIVAGVRVFLE